ncbi:MAG TPA: 30S ribosomal protein S3 [bacterium]|nr:30S ribosomal protein S3 [bacterium]
MGHKVSPKAFRLGMSEEWDSRWFAFGNNFVQRLKEDEAIRKFLTKKLKDAGLEKVVIERAVDSIIITVYSSKPGVIIGRGGASIEELKNHIIKKIIAKNNKSHNIAVKNRDSGKIKLQINIKEVNKPQLSAPIMSQNMASDLEKRIPFRRAMKRSMESIMKAGAEGVKVIASGRLDGAEIARKETLVLGKIPLHTIRANIDYGTATAFTTYGAVGIKFWIYKGEKFS